MGLVRLEKLIPESALHCFQERVVLYSNHRFETRPAKRELGRLFALWPLEFLISENEVEGVQYSFEIEKISLGVSSSPFSIFTSSASGSYGILIFVGLSGNSVPEALL